METTIPICVSFFWAVYTCHRRRTPRSSVPTRRAQCRSRPSTGYLTPRKIDEHSLSIIHLWMVYLDMPIFNSDIKVKEGRCDHPHTYLHTYIHRMNLNHVEFYSVKVRMIVYGYSIKLNDICTYRMWSCNVMKLYSFFLLTSCRRGNLVSLILVLSFIHIIIQY